MGEQFGKEGQPTPRIDADPIAFSNAIRLTCREWLVVVLFAVLLLFVPWIWKQNETFEPNQDYRLPHELGNDYWLFERWAVLAADRFGTVCLGDSVVWVEYAARTETLSHYLNELAGRQACANLGLDGAHPLALEGLVEYYASSIRGKNVLLQCNPLWLSSPRADLQDDKATDFNHPQLVAQFLPRIPSYKAELSARIGIVVQRRVGLNSWTNHLQQAYFGGTDLPSWTLEHPYDNPLAPLARGLPAADNAVRHIPQPWYKSGIARQDYPWVDLEMSLQWGAFQRVVKLLRHRGNRIFVLVGPFNEHMLSEQSLPKYRQIKAAIAEWLQTQEIPHAAPPALARELYGDASHPLAAGYAVLARLIHEKWPQ
jgi:hypothetical protein